MSRARLRELRMVGFKSFAERTVVQFGPGISAVVGPNGSGKSNLADALRWSLGEQGRALRTRRAEDLIFAGSASRRAVGMADVSLVIDNEDRLLSVDYGEVELSRRLFRSGENEYLLNRQRVRLRDLIDLLDDANIADNAFLFIGQGMVDQALALRPEERRPLFEEAAGIRKHERRRRRAEADLAEAETNLERVRDLLAELRPQARRLAAQAEQQEAREVAGRELAEALVAAARARLREVGEASRRQAESLAAARREADVALAALREAEESAAQLTRALAERAEVEQALRERLDAARAAVLEARLEETRVTSESDAIARDRRRLAAEREAAAVRADESRRQLAAALPEPEHAADEALEEAERRLSAAQRDLDVLATVGRADEERAASARLARERLAADADRAARRAGDAERRLHDQRRLAAAAGEVSARQAERAAAASQAAAAAQAAEEAAEREAAGTRLAQGEAEAEASAAADDLTRRRGELEGLRARREVLERQLAQGPDDRVLRSLRARGGRRLVDGLEVEPGLRLAVEAALGDALGGLVLDVGHVSSTAEAAVLVLRDSPEAHARPAERVPARLEQGILEAGGGFLGSALRRDPEGHVGRLLARCAWVADLPTALSLRDRLAPGWRLVTRDGVVLDDVGILRPAPAASLLERRVALEDVERRLAQSEPQVAEAAGRSASAAAAREAAEAASAGARAALEAARRARRVADETLRAAAAAAENAAREHAWQAALLERLEAESAAATQEASQRAADLAGVTDAGEGSAATPDARAALAAARARAENLRAEREAAARSAAAVRAERDRVAEDRRRAEVSLGVALGRLEELDRDELAAAGREADLAARRERLAVVLTAALATEGREAAAFSGSIAAARDERRDLLAAETRATEARERLRIAEARARQGEVSGMEARLQLDAAREGLLVELAAIGADGLQALVAAVPGQPPADDEEEELSARLERALETALRGWSEAGAAAWMAEEEPPGRARIAALRRRFNELGAGNPFALRELAEVRERLTSLEAQREDLEHAIRDTRELIARLGALMIDQFRSTFEALEGAFSRRFQQLFGGGEAQLLLTDPEDLAATGVDITARPPGKKRQPLAMLSGGERALTAVALLLAMLEVRPVPFCVLDEVDAALDEANIERFSSALRSLAEEIQFVVITHNRGTIEAADALYGVTVGDDAVSRVVSLRLDDLPSVRDAAVGAGAAR